MSTDEKLTPPPERRARVGAGLRAGGLTLRRAALVLVVALVAALCVTLSEGDAHPSTSSALTPRSTSADDSTGTGVLALDSGNLDNTPTPAAGDYLVIQPWEYARIPALRAENPGVRILMYKDSSATGSEASDDGTYSTGVSYQEAADTHPEWFLTDASGTRLEWSDWSGLYPMDVGNSSYQQAWSDNVLQELRAHDWDGVMIDDTLTSLSHTTVDGLTSTQIPTDQAMYAATGSFLSQVGPAVRRAGYLAIPNVTVTSTTWQSALTDWTSYVSGWENEYFVKSGTDDGARFTDDDWQWKSDMAAWCARLGVPLLAITYGYADDTTTQTYARATWLLTWNGTTGASIFVPIDPDASHWLPEANADLGAPAGTQQVLDDGVHLRLFTHGLALVNPTDTAQVVPFPWGFHPADAPEQTSISLDPGTAALLSR